MMVSDIEQKIAEILVDDGFELVRLKNLSKFDRHFLELMIDKLDHSPVTIGDCSFVSKKVSVLLNLDRKPDDFYSLDVSSPGLDRPLLKLADYVRFVSSEVKLKLKEKINDMAKFRAIIKQVTNDQITFELLDAEKTLITVAFSAVDAANLVPKINFKG